MAYKTGTLQEADLRKMNCQNHKYQDRGGEQQLV